MLILSFKILYLTRDLTATGAPTNVAYDGVGFRPRLIVFTVGAGTDLVYWSIGSATANLEMGCTYGVGDSTTISRTTYCIAVQTTNEVTGQSATLVSMDADGFTLAWTKWGTPTAAARIIATCYR